MRLSDNRKYYAETAFRLRSDVLPGELREFRTALAERTCASSEKILLLASTTLPIAKT